MILCLHDFYMFYTNVLSVGHTKVRCQKPAKEADTGLDNGYGADAGDGFGASAVVAEDGGQWAPVAAEPVAVGGGSGW